MARRKRNSTPQRRNASRAQRKTRSDEPAPLLVIDQGPILKKALTQCRRLRNELDKKQARLRQFEEEELSAYQRWFNSTFGRQLTELRELRESLQAYEFVAEQLGWCEMCRPEKLPEVYAELKQRMKDGTLHAFEPPGPDEPQDEDDDDDDDIFGNGDDDDIFDDLEEAFGEAFKSFFGDDAMDEDEGDERPEHGSKHRHQAPQTPEMIAMKSLYRTLAKRLHPDHSELEEALRERRWHELQKAYDAHDLEALQRIEAVCDMEDAGGLSIRLGLARLRDLAAYHRMHVQPIRNALREAKRHPAFDFSKADKGHLRSEVEFELSEQRYRVSDRRDWLRNLFEEYGDDIAEDAAAAEPQDEPSQDDDDDGDDFWDNYTAWRDEELRRQSK